MHDVFSWFPVPWLSIWKIWIFTYDGISLVKIMIPAFQKLENFLEFLDTDQGWKRAQTMHFCTSQSSKYGLGGFPASHCHWAPAIQKICSMGNHTVNHRTKFMMADGEVLNGRWWTFHRQWVFLNPLSCHNIYISGPIKLGPNPRCWWKFSNLFSTWYPMEILSLN